MPKHDHTSGAACGECGLTGELYIHARCHVESPLEASLTSDVLSLNCFTCKKLIVKFIVSPFKTQA